MSKIIIRLLVVALLIVGIGWLVLKFVDFPGDFGSLKSYYENHREKVSSVVIEKALNIINLDGYEVTEFTNKKNSYEEIVIQIKSIFEDGKAKNFTWQNEKKLKSSMNKTFNTDNELKDYIISVSTYATSAEPDTTTVQNMINNTVEKFTNILKSFEELKKEINSYLIEETNNK